MKRELNAEGNVLDFFPISVPVHMLVYKTIWVFESSRSPDRESEFYLCVRTPVSCPHSLPHRSKSHFQVRLPVSGHQLPDRSYKIHLVQKSDHSGGSSGSLLQDTVSRHRIKDKWSTPKFMLFILEF